MMKTTPEFHPLPLGAAATPSRPPTNTSVESTANRRRRGLRRRFEALAYGSVPFILIIVLWIIVTEQNVWPPYLFPSPGKVVSTTREYISSGRLFDHFTASFQRVLVGWIVGIGAAIPLALAMGINRRAALAFKPLITFFNAIPALAWVPFAMLWFGIGYKAVTFIIFISVFFPVLHNTILGLRSIPPNLVAASTTLGANRWDLIRHVYIPGALAHMISGVRIGAAYGWRTIVGAEMLAASSGLGYMLFNARQQLRPDVVLLGMISFGLVWTVIDVGVLRRLERKTIERWGLVN